MTSALSLPEAIAARRLDLVKALLTQGVDVNVRGKDGSTPLRTAAVTEQVEVVQLLLAKGAAVNTSDRYGKTPMYKAAWAGHTKIVELLLESGAKIAAEGADGRTPLHWAAIRGNLPLTKVLLDHGARVDVLDRTSRQTPLAYASKLGHTAVVNLHVARGARGEVEGGFAATPEVGADVVRERVEPMFPYHGDGKPTRKKRDARA